MIQSDLSEKSIFNKQEKSMIKKGYYVHTAFMVNYFSMGDCAKIGYEFEMKRTNSRCGNMCMYVISGMKRLCCGCCWTKEESVPLNQQIKYARHGSDVDNMIEKQNALMAA